MGILIGIQFLIISIFLLFGWAIRYKKNYWLISGFASRPETEQQEVIANGLPQRIGDLFLFIGIAMLLLMPLHLTTFEYKVELQFGFLIVFLLGGMIYLSRYEIPRKRKRSYIFSTVIFFVTIGFIGYISFKGYGDYTIKTKSNSFEITGMYGDEWNYEDLTKVKLLTKMPEIQWKQDGFGTETIAKGRFKVKNYGSSILFIQKGSSPYLYIETKNKKIFINGDNAHETKEWYKKLTEKRQP